MYFKKLQCFTESNEAVLKKWAKRHWFVWALPHLSYSKIEGLKKDWLKCPI